MKQLLSSDELHQGVGRLAHQIGQCYGENPLTIIGVLTGSLVLLADLMRLLKMPLRVGVVQASSYRGTSTRRGPLLLNSELMLDVADRDLLLVDDIYDTGHTLAEVSALVDRFGPRSVRTAVLLRKEGRQQASVEPTFVAFDVPDEFVVGYGLDYNDHFRNLPYLAVLEEAELDGKA